MQTITCRTLGTLARACVQGRLHGHGAPAAEESVGNKDGLGATVAEAASDGGGAVAAEQGQDSSAYFDHRQEGDSQFGYQRHVEADGITAADTEAAEGIGAAADFLVKLGVGEGDGSAFLPFKDECGLGRGRGRLVLVKAVVDDVHLAADAPAGEGCAVGQVDCLRVGLGEADVEVLHHRIPEPGDIFD